MTRLTPEDFSELVRAASERGDHERVAELARRYGGGQQQPAQQEHSEAQQPEGTGDTVRDLFTALTPQQQTGDAA